MSRKLFCMVVATILVVSVCMAVYAASGTIRVDIGGIGEVTLYQVGSPEGIGHRLHTQYGGGYVTFDDVLSEDLAGWLSDRAKNGTTQKSKQGVATFSGLNEGLYLVVQTGKRDGYSVFAPFLVSLPWDGDSWEVDASPKMERESEESPQTGDAILPVFGTIMVCITGLTACWLWRKNY